MKYKVGDKVLIKSLDWFNKTKNEYDNVACGNTVFVPEMVKYCEKIVTISSVLPILEVYHIKEDGDMFDWTDEMIDCLVERNGKTYPYKIGDRVVLKGNNRCATITDLKYNSRGNLSYYIKIDNDRHSIDYPTELLLPYKEPKFKIGDILFYRGETSGYLKVEEIREENGEIRYYETSRNVYLVENDPDVFADKVCSVETEETKPIDLTVKGEETKERIEITIPEGYEYVIESGKIIFTKKKKEYPKTYEECCDVLSIPSYYKLRYYTYEHGYNEYTTSKKLCLLQDKLNRLSKLLICRDAYWKLYGEEMGLDCPWAPDWNDEKQDKYGFYNEVKYTIINPAIFVFPTEEMRDAFKDNFKKEIEICKELL